MKFIQEICIFCLQYFSVFFFFFHFVELFLSFSSFFVDIFSLFWIIYEHLVLLEVCKTNWWTGKFAVNFDRLSFRNVGISDYSDYETEKGRMFVHKQCSFFLNLDEIVINEVGSFKAQKPLNEVIPHFRSKNPPNPLIDCN